MKRQVLKRAGAFVGEFKELTARMKRRFESRLLPSVTNMGLGYGDYAIERLLAMTGQSLAAISPVLRAESKRSV